MEIYREKAEQIAQKKREEHRDSETGKYKPSPQNFGDMDKHASEAVVQFAKIVQSNPETVRQALWLEQNAPEKIPDRQNFVEREEDEKGKAIAQFAKVVQSNPETVRQEANHRPLPTVPDTRRNR